MKGDFNPQKHKCSEGYNQKTGGAVSHKKGAGKGKFLGDTKGNRDLPTNRTSGVKQGAYSGK
jgi:hypothetical protein